MAPNYLILLFLVVYVHSSPIEPRDDVPEYRLPADTIETSYYNIELRMETDVFETNTFTGTVSIFFKTLKTISEIKLHANKIDISDVILVSQDATIYDLTNANYQSDSVTDILTLTTAIPLSSGTNFQLQFNYTGHLRTDEMYGWYRSYYIAPDNTRRYLATTQFQTNHARKVFPCFDEPIYKATFDISIRYPSQYNAVGNTAGSTRTNNNYKVTTFSTTPKMSTYLIAFVVSDFTCDTSDELIEEGVPHIVCSRDEEKDNRKVALDTGPKVIHVMENFTGIKYSYSTITKMHEFAIPDFSAGAMENWGLLTYRETGLLWDENESSNSNLQSIKNVIAHEVAHMWFGDLVTCHWWSDTFLNEGFARYFQYHATAEIEPSWELDRQFVTAQVQSILSSDASLSSQPLSYEASSPSELSARFGSVSYNKGATILRWLTYILGYNNFKAGIQKYLAENVFSNTYPVTLWSALQTTTPSNALPIGTSLAEVIDNWIVEAGYPVLNVKSEGSNVVITQERFLTSGSSGTKWYVPISYTLSSDSDKFQDTSTRVWLLPNANNVVINNVLNNDDDWIILNNQQIGYYRINYDDDLWDRIQKALNSPGFGGTHVLNRAQLVDDIYNFAKIGLHSYSRVLDFYQFLKKDNSYYPWYSAITAFSNMLQRTGDENIRNNLSTHILDLIEVLYNTHPFNDPKNDNQIYTFNRVQAATWACRLGLQDCVNNALAAFSSYKETKVKPDKNLKSVIYCNGLRHSTNAESDWNFLWEEYENTKLAAERVTLISSLGCAKDKNILSNYLRKSIDPSSGIRQQDALSVFSAVYTGNPEGVDIAFDFVLENFEEVSTFYGSMNSMSSLFSGIAARFTRQDQVDKFRQFIDNNDLGDHLTAANTALNTAVTNLLWIEQFEKEMNLYFTKPTPKPTEGPTQQPTPPTEGETETGTADAISASFATVMISCLILIFQFFNL